jgi:hypothetical protein
MEIMQEQNGARSVAVARMNGTRQSTKVPPSSMVLFLKMSSITGKYRVKLNQVTPSLMRPTMVEQITTTTLVGFMSRMRVQMRDT